MSEETAVKSGIRAEVAFGLAVLGIVFLLIVPLPTFVLDALLAFNIATSAVILLLVLNAKEPLELSTYPTIVLLTALFRLALNIASTRLILLTGNAGHVIDAFGKFVVGGNLVVGLIVFGILIIINFVVITKGSGRVSEVAARFTLDAMPGKQMSIDADLSAGMIDDAQARERRDKITAEAEFYGAMDGASKFVRGDAVAGLLITIINIAGGVILGVIDGQSIGEALQKYSILTVGDGLVSQIPSLLSSVAAGMLVTKATTKRRFALELSSQFLAHPRALGIGAGAVSCMAFIPGFPALPFLAMGGGLALLARRTPDAETVEPKAPVETQAPEKPNSELTPEAMGKLLHVDRMGIEVGYRLVSLGESERPGSLLDHIGRIRRQFASTLGVIVPPIRLRDNLVLDANQYRILVAGQEVARGVIYPGQHLAMNPGTVAESIPGIKGTDPTFGLPATWIKEDRKLEAETLGYTVVDAVSVLVTHLSETLKMFAHEIMTRDDVQTLIDRLKETSPAVVNELVPNVLGLGDIQRVLQNLLKERIPVRNLGAILECLADHGKQIKDTDHLTELTRQRLARVLCDLHKGRDGVLRVLVCEPRLENHLDQAITSPDAAPLLPALVQKIQIATAEAYGAAVKKGYDSVLLVRSSVRRFIAEQMRFVQPRIAVLSYDEIHPTVRVEPSGQVVVPVEAGVA